MEVQSTVLKPTNQQQRVLKLIFKFRFVSCQSLADVMGIRREAVYRLVERLVKQRLVTKVYAPEFRINRKPAYYYLNKSGVTTVRKIMDVKESVVHALYNNSESSEEFIGHYLELVQFYAAIMPSLPGGSDVFTKTEIIGFKQFPKSRPDLYIRTADGREAMVVLIDDKPACIIRKKFEEIFTHSENEGWNGDYPRISFVLKDGNAKNSFIYTTCKKLDSMGIDEDDLSVLATSLSYIKEEGRVAWSNMLKPDKFTALFM